MQSILATHLQHISSIVVLSLSPRDRCTLASTCKELREFLYDPKWWAQVVELPYAGTAEASPPLSYVVPPNGQPVGIFSALLPPKDILALENLLEAMVPGKQRFVNVKQVEFKNYMFTDKAIELAVELFPSLERLDLDGARVTSKGMQLLKGFKKLRYLSVHCKYERNWNPEEWLSPLESHLERLQADKGPSKDLFMKQCKQCRFYFNPKFNTNTSCLFHPGKRIFRLTFNKYGLHVADTGSCYHQDWPRELYDIPFVETLELTGSRYLAYRRPASCGEQVKPQQHTIHFPSLPEIPPQTSRRSSFS